MRNRLCERPGTEVVGGSHPLNGEPPCKREARRLFRNVKEVLNQVGADFADVVRIDQYYTGAHAVDPYHEVRREVFENRIPPSTSNLHQRFARAGQTIEVQVMAVVPGHGIKVQHHSFTPSYKIHHTSGYSPALSAGDFRFLPGQTAEARKEEEGPLDPEARRPPGLWKGTAIKLETEFIVRRKMKPSLEAAGSSLNDVVKAQVYLRDYNDVPAFNEVWYSHFDTPPATTIIPTATPGFIMPESRIEINVIALASNGSLRKEVVSGDVEPLFHGSVSAIRAGELLFFSGLMGLENGKLASEAAMRQPFFASPLKAEMRSILRQAEAICRRAGTTLKNAVRIQQFHTKLEDLPWALEVWDEALMVDHFLSLQSRYRGYRYRERACLWIYGFMRHRDRNLHRNYSSVAACSILSPGFPICSLRDASKMIALTSSSSATGREVGHSLG